MRAPPRSRLPSAVIGLCLALFLPWLLLQFAGRSGHEPSRALLAGVLPWSAQRSVEDLERHRYDFSAWEAAIAAESEHTELDAVALRALGDEAASAVAWWMIAESGEGQLRAAEAALWEAEGGELLLRKIGEILHKRGVRVLREPLPLAAAQAQPGRIHLDPDALVLLILHIGYRLDLDLYAAMAPANLYIRYQGPTGQPPLFFDPSRLTGPRLSPQLTGRAQTRPTTTGAVPEALVRATQMDEPRTTEDLRDGLLTRLVLSLAAAGIDRDAEALLGPRLAHTRDHRLVRILHNWRLGNARIALTEGRPEDAARHAAEAILARQAHADLYLDDGIEENIRMDEAMQQIRQDAASRGALDRAIARGEAEAVCEVLRPLGEPLFELLPSCR